MASIAGLYGIASLAAYVGGKAGIIGLTKAAALDYADQGIRVNVVAPGPILTHHLERTGATVPIDGGQFAGLKPARMYRPGQPMETNRS